MKGLTQAEKATNAETWEHINNVMKLLAKMQLEISKRMFSHDRSKLGPSEVEIFTEYTSKLATSTYGSEEYMGFLKGMKPALDHHYAKNRHHPEHFEHGIDDMNLIDLIEMLCDWKAATMRHNDGNIEHSLKVNKKRFDISPELIQIFKNTFRLIEG